MRRRGGRVKTLAPLNYAPGEDLLFAEHFDNCVWGCDYAAETGGYGVGAGSSVPSPATSAGTEAAYVAKGPERPAARFSRPRTITPRLPQARRSPCAATTCATADSTTGSGSSTPRNIAAACAVATSAVTATGAFW
ncbi:MAG: hypothetical protein ACLUYV_05340 [Alistipes shahii]